MQQATRSTQVVENRLKAMSHPVRREVLRILVERLASPSEIGQELNLPTANVSHHVKRLVDLECAELVEERKVQGAIQHIYRATEQALISTDEWDRLHPVEAQSFVAEIMQKILDDFLASEKAKLVGLDTDFHLSRTPVAFDHKGLQEGVALLDRVRLDMAEIGRRSERRSQETAVIPLSVSLALFKVSR